MKDFLEAGVIVGTHGIHGDMKVKLLCDDYKTFAALERVFIDGEERRIAKRSPYKNIALVRLEGTDTPEDAALAFLGGAVARDPENKCNACGFQSSCSLSSRGGCGSA